MAVVSKILDCKGRSPANSRFQADRCVVVDSSAHLSVVKSAVVLKAE